jgi:hypothetical protein
MKTEIVLIELTWGTSILCLKVYYQFLSIHHYKSRNRDNEKDSQQYIAKHRINAFVKITTLWLLDRCRHWFH